MMEIFSNIERILTSVLGETRRGFSDNGQAQFNCPCCAAYNGGVPDNKYNLEVNLVKMRFMCWKCSETDGTHGSIGKLIKSYGSPSEYRMLMDEVESIRKSGLYDMDLFSGNTLSDANVADEEERIRLPKTFRRIRLDKVRNRRLKAFLEERRIDQRTIDRFGIGYTAWEEEEPEYRCRVILPSYDAYGDLNYWVGRDFSGYGGVTKYRNCKADKKKIVFHESLIDWDADVFLVEGPMDAIRLPNGISMLGKSLAKDCLLYESIMQKCNANVIVALDGDTKFRETKRIYSLLDHGRLKGKVRYLDMKADCKYKDMSALYEREGRKGICGIIGKTREISEFEMVCE